MATYAFVHGGGGSGAEFDLLAAELRGLGHDVVAPDLPIEDEDADLAGYAQTVVDAIGDRTGVVVVAHSLGAFTAPIVCEWTPVDLLVLLAAMVPAPGESFSEWWANTGYDDAARRYLDPGADPVATFMHDVPPGLVAAALARERKQAGKALEEPWPLEAWPDVPTRFLLFRDDRDVPGPLVAGGRPAAARHHPGRDGRQPLRLPEPPEGAGPAARGLPDGTRPGLAARPGPRISGLKGQESSR